MFLFVSFFKFNLRATNGFGGGVDCRRVVACFTLLIGIAMATELVVVEATAGSLTTGEEFDEIEGTVNNDVRRGAGESGSS